MYHCEKCGKDFVTPEVKPKNFFQVFILTLKSVKDSSISREDCYVQYCPGCGSTKIREKDKEENVSV